MKVALEVAMDKMDMLEQDSWKSLAAYCMQYIVEQGCLLQL